jgi:hypothetical protein
MVITDLGVFSIDKNGGGMTLIELAEGVSLDEVKAKTGRLRRAGFSIGPWVSGCMTLRMAQLGWMRALSVSHADAAERHALGAPTHP